MSECKPYQSDLSDEQWALIEPVLTAWKNRHRSVSGHQGRYPMREIVNSILYQCRTGCQWALLPNDLPPKSATYYYFASWRDDDTDQQIHELLCCQVRERNRRLEDPILVILDTQIVRAATGVPAVTTGKDAAKRVPGRKRGLAVDVRRLQGHHRPPEGPRYLPGPRLRAPAETHRTHPSQDETPGHTRNPRRGRARHLQQEAVTKSGTDINLRTAHSHACRRWQRARTVFPAKS